jgi:L-rhamnose-H+ transport protein
MTTLLGIFFHTIGGFCAGSFYLPLKKVQHWSWESYWLINGIVAWLIVPIIVAIIIVPNFWHVLLEAPKSNLAWSFFFGVLWGIGGLTFGLTMRFLGMALGMAMALGITAIIGTVVPQAYSGELLKIVMTDAGKVTMLGVFLIGVGIIVCGFAGLSKEKDGATSEAFSGVISEFNLLRGFVVASIAGVMSACMAFGLAAGKPISETALRYGVPFIWQNTASFVVIFSGGLATNLVWCLFLNWKNSSFSDYRSLSRSSAGNYLLCALAGLIWYGQFMFYGIGTTYMGEFEFAGWSLHMAFIIIFSTMWGFITKEWGGASRRTLATNSAGLSILVVAIVVIGYGSYLQY